MSVCTNAEPVKTISNNDISYGVNVQMIQLGVYKQRRGVVQQGLNGSGHYEFRSPMIAKAVNFIDNITIINSGQLFNIICLILMGYLFYVCKRIAGN